MVGSSRTRTEHGPQKGVSGLNDYRFTLLTLTQSITTGTSGAATQAPWSNTKTYETIPMPGAALSTIILRDDDGVFQSSRYNAGETGQVLTAAVTFGNDAAPTAAGTALSFHTSSVIRTRNSDGTEDRFLALFPRRFQPGAVGAELGGRCSVILMPIARNDGSFPVFDLARSYSFQEVRSIGTVFNATPYVPAAVPCFATGTLIETATGPCPVESIRPGDQVLTRDHGHQPVRWAGGAHVSVAGLELRPNLRPIRIRAGALGHAVPARDLLVSPQHRVLIRSRISHRLFQDAEVMVAAKHLVGLPGISVAGLAGGVTYHHLLFDRHEAILSDGCWTESLYTGPQALLSLPATARREILALFPELGSCAAPEPARRLLTGREARQLAQQQQRNADRRHLVEPL